MNPDRWMTFLYEKNPNVPFNQILLPGTHDSATAELNSPSFTNLRIN